MAPHWTRTAAAALCALLLARAGAASPPSASTSTVPTCIALVGSHGGVVDPAGEFDVIVRDAAYNGMPNQQVTLDFSGCSGIVLGGSSGPVFPGMTVDCTHHTVSAMSDLRGTARFRVAGAGIRGVAGPSPGSAFVSASNVPLGTCSVSIFDLDGVNGVNAADLAVLLQGLLQNLLHPGTVDVSRMDYDCSGTLTSADVSAWLTMYRAGGSTVSAVPCGP